MASCYSEEYKKLYDESQQAIECPKSSEIADKIDEISKIFDSMNLEWDDPVKTNFDEFKKSLVQILGKISASINTYLASAEDTYSDLSTTLGDLKKDDESYSYLLDHEPTKNKKQGIVADISVKVDSSANVSSMAFKIQQSIKHNVESMTNYKVAKVDVHVQDVIFPENPIV